MFQVLVLDRHDVLQPQTRHVYLEEGAGSRLDVHVLEQPVNAAGKGHHSGVYRQVVLALVYVVGDDLDREVGQRQKPVLGQKHGADPFGILKMAELECDVLLQPV